MHRILPSTEDTSLKQLIKLNCLLANLLHSNSFTDSLSLFVQIHSSSHPKPDHYSLSTALTACAKIPNIHFGTQLHSYALRTGLNGFNHVSNSLLSLYAKSNHLGCVKMVFSEMGCPDVYSWTTLLSACAKMGEIGYAYEVFDEMPVRNVAIWNALITGCAEKGERDIRFDLFKRMHVLGVRHDNYTFGSVLSLCSWEFWGFGRQVHCLIVKSGFFCWTSVFNSLISMYFNCGAELDAFDVFEEVGVLVKDEISYNSMISGLLSLKRDEEALLMFKEMVKNDLRPTASTFVSLLSSCLDANVCLQVYAQAIKIGFETSVRVSNAAMGMYAKLGKLDEVKKVFVELEGKDIVSWNAVINSYAQNGFFELAMSAYVNMQRDGFGPDEYTIGSVLGASESLEDVEMFHALVLKIGLSFINEVANALVSAISRQSDINRAYQIFYEMRFKNLISWNAIISGFVLNGFLVQGLELFTEMLNSKVKPDVYTLTIVLSICAGISSSGHGKQVHGYISRNGFFDEPCLGNALITMYAKCGVLNWSVRVFDYMLERDIVSWNSVISAFAQYGEGKKAVAYFEKMKRDIAVRPDQATFTAVLSACSRAGLMLEGIRIFDSMVNDYGLKPEADQFSCLVDLLGRAGFLDETEELIDNKRFTVEPNVWWTFFSACAAYGNVRLGRIVARILLEIERNNPTIYVMLSNIHASVGQWDEAANMRELMKRVGVIKLPGYSWIKS